MIRAQSYVAALHEPAVELSEDVLCLFFFLHNEIRQRYGGHREGFGAQDRRVQDPHAVLLRDFTTGAPPCVFHLRFDSLTRSRESRAG